MNFLTRQTETFTTKYHSEKHTDSWPTYCLRSCLPCFHVNWLFWGMADTSVSLVSSKKRVKHTSKHQRQLCSQKTFLKKELFLPDSKLGIFTSPWFSSVPYFNLWYFALEWETFGYIFFTFIFYKYIKYYFPSHNIMEHTYIHIHVYTYIHIHYT